IRSVADHDQPAGNDAGNPLEDVEDVHHSFYRPKVRYVAEQLVIRCAEQLTEGRAVALKPFWIDEVRDDFDRLVRVEAIRRLVFQPSRDGGDTIGDFDAELRDRKIAGVAPDQRDISTVNRGDHFQSGGAEDLLG